MKRLLILLPIFLLSFLATAPMASAHTQLVSSDPKDGAQVAVPPQQITLTFNEPVQADQTTVTVSGADGTAWTVGQITGKDATLLVPVTPTGPAGLYTLNFKIGSADDHAVTGAVKFTMTVPLTTTTTPPPTTTTTPSSAAPSVAPAADVRSDQGSGMPWWVWLIVAVGVLAAAGAVVFLRKRSATSA